MRAIRSIVGIAFLLAAVASPAEATWLPDGSPVVTGAGSRSLQSVVADGTTGLFVTWVEPGPSPQIKVQRLRADGDITPGWPAQGFGPPTASIGRGNPHVLPDGAGGCYLAWDEDTYVNYNVRLQHVLASGAPDPAWPATGVLVAQGMGFGYGTYTRYATLALAPATGGGCVVAVLQQSGGCHDGYCTSGGSLSFRSASTTGVLSSWAEIEPFCASGAQGMAVADGGSGFFVLTSSPCSPQLRFRHSLVGGEPPVLLPVSGSASACRLARAADGSVLAVVQPSGGGLLMFHWNSDGTPAAGAPAAGVTVPGGLWAPDASGSSVFVVSASGTLSGMRFEPDGSGTPGWPLPLASAPAVVYSHAAGSDGAGGVVAVWQDTRNADHDLYVTRRFADGAPASGVPASGLALCTAPGGQWLPRVMTLEPGVSIAVWEDLRSGYTEIYAQRISLDVPVPATASLVRAEARPGRVELEWRFTEAVPEVVFERSRDGSEWSEIARVVPGSLGRVTYEDTDVRPGESLAYRIHFQSGDQRVWTVPVWVEIPRVELALRVMPPATQGRLSLEVTLASDEPARLELMDVSGRRLQRHDLSHFGTDPTRLELELNGIASGIAWLRLRQGSEMRTLRVAIAR